MKPLALEETMSQLDVDEHIQPIKSYYLLPIIKSLAFLNRKPVKKATISTKPTG